VDSFTLKKTEFGEIRRILCEFCACTLGKALALRMSPSRNPETIQRWLKQVSQTVEAIRDVGLPPFGGVTDVTEALRRAHPGAGATGEDFAAIASALEAAGALRGYLDALPEHLDTLHELAGGISRFDGEVKAIRGVVDPDGSVRDDASERLSRLRLEIQATSRKIHDVIYGYLQNVDVAKLLQNPTVTLHGDRYVLPVKAENRGRLPGVVHRASNTGATVFVEPNASVELNNHLADLAVDERREIERLLNVLSIRIQARGEEMAASLRTIAQVDLISAKAQYAYQNDFTCPEVSERGSLQFAAARHPLLVDQVRQQDKQGVPAENRHSVVPIDVRLGSDFDLLVITGSNTGGKTVTLKTVALLVLMAQSGMHIPVRRGATMPVFRDVLIDVGDEQSLQQSLSTFGAHVKRIGHILRNADPSCLVLLDELGSGTDPDEGGAMGQAILDELRQIGCMGMVTTHLSVLKAYAYNHERVDNASVEFDTVTMTPTYHLRIGTPGESHAIAVAARLGLTKRLIGAAKRHLAEQGKQFRKAIRATGQARQVAEEARAQAVEAEQVAKQQQEVYESKLADLHRLQREFETWLATLPELSPGDEVAVPSLHKTGKLVRLELHRQIAVVDADNIQVEVPLKELMPDLGQSAVREQINALRQQILDQAGHTEQIRAEAEHIRQEYHRALEQQKLRARQFDTWLNLIGRVKVDDEVPIAVKPGKGKVVKIDLQGLRALIDTPAGDITVSLQDLFPQVGPFAMRPPRPERVEGRGQRGGPERGGQRGDQPGGQQRPERAGQRDQRGPRPEQGERGQRPPREGQGQGPQAPGRPPQRREEPPEEPNRPMDRGRAAGRAANAKRDAVMAVPSGQQVYVVPFHKRATLIRYNEEKDIATVQSGIFEIQVPLADIEVIPAKPAPVDAKAAKKKPERKGRPDDAQQGAAPAPTPAAGEAPQAPEGQFPAEKAEPAAGEQTPEPAPAPAPATETAEAQAPSEPTPTPAEPEPAENEVPPDDSGTHDVPGSDVTDNL
jgi:DNA mismatch repair protein MutS2